MIAGRSRFYFVAALAGAIAGELAAAGLALTVLPAVSRVLAERSLVAGWAIVAVAGAVGGACAGFVLTRRWFRRDDLERGRPAGRT